MIREFKTSVREYLRPHPALLGWIRRLTNAFGVTSPSEHDYIFRLAERRGQNVFFVQIGANDGLNDDLIHYFVRAYGWRGILLEPLPQMFERLKTNYGSAASRLTFVNAALSSQEGSAPFYRTDGSDELPSWCNGTASFSRELIAAHRHLAPNIESHIVEDRVDCISFASLVDRYKPSHIDLLVIDTEGYDLEILRQIDLVRYRPELIVFEHQHLSDGDRREASDLLTARGYKIASTRWPNTIASPATFT
jgi:FkbM family methyltransferase